MLLPLTAASSFTVLLLLTAASSCISCRYRYTAETSFTVAGLRSPAHGRLGPDGYDLRLRCDDFDRRLGPAAGRLDADGRNRCLRSAAGRLGASGLTFALVPLVLPANRRCCSSWVQTIPVDWAILPVVAADFACWYGATDLARRGSTAT
ncbi:hypothetical protein PHYPSEUDO_015193 [Phytophthora pseudosyringae]|uniref:Secreted protein n=1 Tax=Phytophthora pseudosyringae TaxID=221518 RepID=A0A8T1V4A8_9STRA|nr:hypothetical protein PHYPSEUDO_015193 [Phytophthora pseudosyringae]